MPLKHTLRDQPLPSLQSQASRPRQQHWLQKQKTLPQSRTQIGIWMVHPPAWKHLGEDSIAASLDMFK